MLKGNARRRTKETTAMTTDVQRAKQPVPTIILARTPVPRTRLRPQHWRSLVAFGAGSNTDEGWLFVYPEYPVFAMNEKEYTKFVTEYIANSAHGTNVPLNSSVVDAVFKV